MNETPSPSLHPATLASRLKRGWSLERALATVNGRRDNARSRYVDAFGERLIVADWSRRFDLPVGVIIRRLELGWAPERAVSEAADGRVIHRHSPRGAPSPEYRVWASMVQRCTNPARKCFPRYGGRGIRVCEAWLASFDAFLADVGPRPHGTSLDRIDNDGDYAPGNVRWATRKEQSDNSCHPHRLTFRGDTRTRADWARHTGIPYWTLRGRLDRGWSVEDALTRPRGWRKP